MGRPATLTDDERMVPCAVSLDKARRDKFKALGGSAWLREVIDAAKAPRCPSCLMSHGQHQPRCPKRKA